MPSVIPHRKPRESDVARQDRLAEELRLLESAETEAEQVGTIPAAEVHAWVRSLSTPNPLPMPRPRRT